MEAAASLEQFVRPDWLSEPVGFEAEQRIWDRAIFCFSLAEQEAAGVYYNALWKKGGQGSAVQPSEYEDDYVLEVGGGC